MRGFTLLELMVVVLIVGLLAAIAIPSYNNAIRSSRRAALVADARELYKSFMRYHADMGGFPPDAGASAFDLATLAPLSTNGYFRNVSSLTAKLNTNAVLIYAAPDIDGIDTQFVAVVQSIHDDSIAIFLGHSEILGGLGGLGVGDWIDGVFLVVDGLLVPTDEGD